MTSDILDTIVQLRDTIYIYNQSSTDVTKFRVLYHCLYFSNLLLLPDNLLPLCSM